MKMNVWLLLWRRCLLSALVMLCGACAGTAPSGKMVNLEYAINDAIKAEAAAYAPLELRFAQDKYDAAQKAIEEKDYQQAERLIDQAQLDAQCAREKALSAKAEKDADDMRQNIESLQKETERLKKKALQNGASQ